MAVKQDDSLNRSFSNPLNPTFVGGSFPNAAARRGAGQARNPDLPVYQQDEGSFWVLRPLSQCFLADGVTPATNRGTWGTRNEHWVRVATLDDLASLVGTGKVGNAAFASLARAAQATVQVLLPEHYSQATADYYVVQRVRGTNRRVINLAQRGFKNDAQLTSAGTEAGALVPGVGTDNATLLNQLQAEIVATASRMRLQGEYYYLFPKGGVSKWSKNLWQAKINNLVVDLNGGAVVTDYDGVDNMLGRISFDGEMMQISLDSYDGRKDYVVPVKIKDVTADSFKLEAVDKTAFQDSETWFIGAYVFDYSQEMIFRGYPIGSATFGDGTLQLVGIDRANGVLTFQRAIGNAHSTKGPDYVGTDGANSGVGRIISLDNPAHPIPDYVEWKNGDVYPARNTDEAFAMVSRVLTKLSKLRFFGNLTLTESLGGVEVDEVEVFGEAELDKAVKGGKIKNSKFHKYLSNAGGFKFIDFESCQSLVGMQVAALRTRIFNMRCNAATFQLYDVTTQTWKDKDSDPSLGRYPGRHYVELLEIGQIGVGATNNTPAYLDPVDIYSYYILRLEGGRIAIDWDGSDNLDMLWALRSVRVGSLIMAKDGSFKTKVTNVEFVPADATLTSGKLLLRVEDGVVLKQFSEILYNNIRGFVDGEGHQILTPAHPAKLYSRASLRWKGNRSAHVQEPGAVVLTKADFAPNQYGADYILWLAGMYEITYEPSAAGPGGRLTLGLVDHNNNNSKHLVNFATNSATVRTAGLDHTAGMTGLVPGDPELPSSGEPELNQFRRDNFSYDWGGAFGYNLNIFTNVPYDQLPDFKLTLTPRKPTA